MHSNNINGNGQLNNLQSLVRDTLNGGKQNSPFERCDTSASGMFQVNPFDNQSVLTPFMNHGNSNPMEMIVNMLIEVFTMAMQNSFGSANGASGSGSPIGSQGFGSAFGGQGGGIENGGQNSIFGQNNQFGGNNFAGYGQQHSGNQQGFGNQLLPGNHQGLLGQSFGNQTSGNYSGNGATNYTGSGQGGGYGSGYGGSQATAPQQGQSYTPESSGAASQGTQSSGGGCPFLGQNGGQDYNSGGDPVQGTGGPDDRDIDFSTLTAEQRTDMGLNATDRGILHLWGRQMISAGKQDGGIYTTVLGPDGTGSGWDNKAEVALVQNLRAQEQELFGGDTGYLLDQAFFDLHGSRTGEDLSARYADRAINFSQGATDITNDIGKLQERTGLDQFQQGVLRLYGHDPLMDGQWDGSVLAYTIDNDNSLDGVTHSEGNTIDNVAQDLFNADINDDGVNNGSSLNNAFISVLDSLYLS
ncbi:hypothetical protein AB833_28730 [Chromatiales bacterium (ex Bugula neritina AB1)]|nr:hypothetical protein AB833_28730 [Chromatiales bacterium (ex Bugula neritina AB1)]